MIRFVKFEIATWKKMMTTNRAVLPMRREWLVAISYQRFVDASDSISVDFLSTCDIYSIVVVIIFVRDSFLFRKKNGLRVPDRTVIPFRSSVWFSFVSFEEVLLLWLLFPNESRVGCVDSCVFVANVAYGCHHLLDDKINAMEGDSLHEEVVDLPN
jgi:hypothetical protein